MDHRNGRFAEEIIALQNDDGTWGTEFHSLAVPTGKKPLTTEQALRRLKILGFTIDDAPVRKAVDCMISCLLGERRIDGYWEKTLDWELFTKLMLSTWVRIFEPDNEIALSFAKRWASIIEKAFESGTYDHEAYKSAYQFEFYQKAKGPREIGFVNFYPINLLTGLLTKKTENDLLDYVISHNTGIYYIYGKPICELPRDFASIETSRYLAAVEILLGYDLAKEKLRFVKNWIEANKDENGQWDLGAKSKDNVYLPLSDSWRKAECRISDCTERISTILEKLKS